MKRLARWLTWLLAIVAFALGMAHPLRVRSARGFALRGLKSISESVAPFAALMGAGVALAARLLRAPGADLLALVGALLSARYVLRLAKPAIEDPTGILQDSPRRLSAQQRAGLMAGPWRWTMPRARGAPGWLRDQIYHVPVDRERTMPPLLCDLWLPPPQVPTTGIALIYIHGGGYFTSHKDFGTRTAFRHLACQGHVIMDIDYRLAPSAMLVDMLSDVKHAVAWMKSNAAWFGADPDRIVLMGGSAGAHLALLTAYAPDLPQLTPIDLAEADLSIRGVISYYGIIDLAATSENLRRLFEKSLPLPPLPARAQSLPRGDRALRWAAWMRGVEPAALRNHLRENMDLLAAGVDTSFHKLVGGSPEQLPEEYRLVSALSHAGASSPPTLLIQAAHDSFVPAEPAQALFARLQEAGAGVVRLELPETEHTFDLFLPQYAPPAQAAMFTVERFLASLI